jgi:hypothetical protein
VSLPPEEASVTAIARRRRARTNALAMIAGSYALDTAILLLYVSAGTTRLAVPLAYAVTGTLICAGFLALYRSRLGERAPDPFFTSVLTVPSAAVQLLFLALAPEVGFVFLTVLFIVFGFGALRLTLPKAVVGWGVTALGVAIVMSLLGRHIVIPTGTPFERWISWLCFALTLGRCVGIGFLGNQYREELGRRTGALRLLNATLEDEVARRTRELALAKEELERLVVQQTAEIKTLRGILPICAHCKKIRDDRGSWSQLEAYIMARTDVLFSHGLCADCRAKHYPSFPRSTD